MQNLLQLRLLPVAGGLKNPGEGLKPLLVYSCKTSDDRAVDIKNTAYIQALLNTQLTRIKKPLESKSFPRACHTT